MSVQPRRRIREATLMRALAHPLRLALLQELMADGPSTASALSATVGSTPSNCSWHLRHLAELGVVERTPGSTGRDRPWRATQVGLDFGEPANDPALRSAQNAVLAGTLTRLQTMVARYVDRQETLDPNTRAAAVSNTYTLSVTSDELAELAARVDDLLRPYLRVHREELPVSAVSVYVGLHAVPALPAGDDRDPA